MDIYFKYVIKKFKETLKKSPFRPIIELKQENIAVFTLRVIL